jgi:hypothetical protein
MTSAYVGIQTIVIYVKFACRVKATEFVLV